MILEQQYILGKTLIYVDCPWFSFLEEFKGYLKLDTQKEKRIWYLMPLPTLALGHGTFANVLMEFTAVS